MLFAQNLVIPVVFSCVLFPKYSKSVKPKDCIIGKTYWSTSITEKGSCVKCPKYWRNCYDEAIGDQPQCVRSCRDWPNDKLIELFRRVNKLMKARNLTIVKPKREPKASSTTTGTGIPLTPTPSLSVIYLSAAQPADVNEGRKSLGSKDIVSSKLLLVICFLGFLVLFLIVVLMVLIGKSRKRCVENRDAVHPEQIAQLAGGNEPEEQTPLTILETPPSAVQGRNTSIQETDRTIVHASSSTTIGGIQADTEEPNFSSALNIAEEYHT